MVVTQPLNLSFGEQKKIFLARAMNRDFKFLILDEPTINLDIETKQRLSAYLNKFAQEKAILLIGHEKELAQIATHIYEIADGELIRER